MSLLSNGSKIGNGTRAFEMQEPTQVGEARRYALTLCQNIGFDEVRQGRVGIVINELGNNLVRYARKGRLLVRPLLENSREGLEILSVDSGPGFDEDRVLRDGFTTGSTPGTGLGAVRRQSDVFDLFSQPQGTVLLSQIYHSDAAATLASKSTFDVAAINLAMEGETLCGDAFCVQIDGTDLRVLMADGLGHGPLAHTAAQEAVAVFCAERTAPTETLLNAIHQRLKSTRGGAIFLVKTIDQQLEFTGVGNIRSVLLKPVSTKTLISQNGTAGLQIRQSRAMKMDWEKGTLLTLHSDGLNTRWDLSAYPGLFHRHPSVIAGCVYRDHDRGSDDTTLVIIRKNP